MNTIHFWPILLATIVSFIISTLWYSPVLFGKEWMSLTGLSEKDMAGKNIGNMWKLYVIQFLTTLISFCILAFIMSTSGSTSILDGASIGILIWGGFVITESISKILWEKRSWKLVMIGSLSTLINLVVGGMIMGIWH